MGRGVVANKMNIKNILFGIITIGALFIKASANDIEPGKQYYTAIKATQPIVLDGDLSEWTGAAILADPRFSIPKGSAENGNLVNFEEHAGGSWTGPDDHTSAVRVVYDDDNIYFGFVVTDEYHENSANSAWNGDSVQLMVANAERDTQVALYNYALGGVEEALGGQVMLEEAGPGGTEAVVTRNVETKRTTYEIKLPKESMELDALIGGTQFGLGMAINDGDKDTPGQKGWGGLGAHAIVFGKSPEQTALITLATANDIEAGKEFHSAKTAPGEIVIDGKLDDWQGVPVLSDPRFAIPKGSGSRKDGGNLSLFEVHAGGSWSGPDDQTSAVQISYDDDNVYFAFLVTDEYHENSANSAWNGDSVQLMIANDKQDTQIALYNYALGGVEDDLGGQVMLEEAGVGGTTAFVSRDVDAKRTIYEIKLPKESMELNSLESGVQFGLGMAINDGDKDTPGQKGWGGLGAHALVFGKSPEQTALVTLDGYAPPSEPCFVSAVTGPAVTSLTNFSFRGNDFEGCEVDPASTKLFIDDKEVALVASAKNQGATDFTHTLDAPFETNSEHTFRIELVDTLGNIVGTESGIVKAPIFGILTPDLQASGINTSNPGFIWRVIQNGAFIQESLADTELNLAGELADENFADPALIGAATGPGIVAGPLLEFEIPSVINLNQLGGDSAGNFPDDLQMPGVPGLNFIADGASAEIVTFVEFPAGFNTVGVNSDDGFRMEAGPLDQPESRELLGQFDATRGASDSIFVFNVIEAGVYPIRVIWNNGGGGANIEIFSIKEDGTKVLFNDVENGGLRAYRGAGGAPFVITAISTAANGDVSLTWNSRAGQSYAVLAKDNLDETDISLWDELDDSIESQGDSTTIVISSDAVNFIAKTGRIFFRVRKQE